MILTRKDDNTIVLKEERNGKHAVVEADFKYLGDLKKLLDDIEKAFI